MPEAMAGDDDKRTATVPRTGSPAGDVVTPAIDEYLFGSFRMDIASMQLWRGEAQVPLPPKAFDTLRVLIANRHRLVTKDELLNAVWPNTFVSEESIHQNITSLRRALGDDHSQPTYIATVARRGYRFVGTAEPRFSRGPADRAPVVEPAPRPIAEADPGSGRELAAASGADTDGAKQLRQAYRRWRVAAVAAAVVAAAAIAALLVTLFTPPAQVTPLRLSVGAPGGMKFYGGALSPDGSRLSVVAEEGDSGVTKLVIKSLSAQGAAPRIVPESEGAARPFWSPDGQWIGFFANGRMKRVGIDGGPVQNLATITGPRSSGGSWGADGTILFTGYMSGVFAMPAGGGEPRSVTRLSVERHEIAHRWPQFLRNGRHFLFSVVSTDRERAGTYVGSLDSAETTRLVPVPGGVWAPPGYLIFVQDRLLMAQRFDEGRLAVVGAPFTLSGEVQAPSAVNNASLSASAGGLLAFTSESNRRSRLEWVTRTGQSISSIPTPIDLFNPSLSPDERMLTAGTGRELWMIDLERNAPTRVGLGSTTAFSPDGSRLTFTSGPVGGLGELHVRDTVGSAHSRVLASGTENKVVTDWSRDGRYIVYCSMNSASQWDMWAVAPDGDEEPRPVVATSFNECHGQVSPNGRWIAYASDESNAWEVYVQAFPGGGSKRVISVGGASEPKWSADGRELFYLAADGTLTAVQFDPTSGAPLRHPARLFRIPIQAAELNTRRNHYVVGRDGQRLLVNSADPERDSLGILLNWTAAIR